jgi:hypothetical protein
MLTPMNTWIFKDGLAEQKHVSFPYAYRAMFNTLKKGVEGGRKYEDMIKQMSIISPMKDAHGDFRRYNYASATEMAKASGLVTAVGEINSREFRKK